MILPELISGGYLPPVCQNSPAVKVTTNDLFSSCFFTCSSITICFANLKFGEVKALCWEQAPNTWESISLQGKGRTESSWLETEIRLTQIWT